MKQCLVCSRWQYIYLLLSFGFLFNCPIRKEILEGQDFTTHLALRSVLALNRYALNITLNPQNHSARQAMLLSFYRGGTLRLTSKLTCPKSNCHQVAELGFGPQSICQTPRPGSFHQVTEMMRPADNIHWIQSFPKGMIKKKLHSRVY